MRHNKRLRRQCHCTSTKILDPHSFSARLPGSKVSKMAGYCSCTSVAPPSRRCHGIPSFMTASCESIDSLRAACVYHLRSSEKKSAMRHSHVSDIKNSHPATAPRSQTLRACSRPLQPRPVAPPSRPMPTPAHASRPAHPAPHH